jgi:hypothetical protein
MKDQPKNPTQGTTGPADSLEKRASQHAQQTAEALNKLPKNFIPPY